MNYGRALRYLAPNLITTANIMFGLLSLNAASEGRYVDAAWFIIYAVLTDRLDGFVARLVRGTSEIGVQLDSFADFLNFGVAPAFLIYRSFLDAGAMPFQEGLGLFTLRVSCGLWVMGATFRLARYNITSEEGLPTKIFFGVPTTLAAGLLISWYLAMAKYTVAGTLLLSDPFTPFGGVRLLGSFETPLGPWKFFPLYMVIGAYLMASSLRMPKLGLTRSRYATVFVAVNVLVGYFFGFAHLYPEYLIWPPSVWLVGFLLWGQISPAARSMRPPPIFPSADPPTGREPVRPEDDLYPEGDEGYLDEPG